MSKPTTQQRLKYCQRAGNLNISELARWFNRPRPTVKEWVELGREPQGAPLDLEHIESLLGLLEALIRRGKGFPVPVGLSAAARKTHLEDIRQRAMPGLRNAHIA